jgi:hypothetical protein
MGETMCGVSAGAEGLALVHNGFVVVEGTHEGVDSAWAAARDVIDAAASLDDLCARIGSRLQRVGEFVVPAPGEPQRDFQGLHLDFGVPSGRAQPLPLARYTALFVDPTVVASGAPHSTGTAGSAGAPTGLAGPRPPPWQSGAPHE